MNRGPRTVYTFGQFRLDAQEKVLFRAGAPVPLTPKDIEILLVLVQNSGRTVEKDRLMQEVWPDTFVEESNLSVHVSQLRKALGDGDGQLECIETVPRRGYRFRVPVEEVLEEQPVTLLERRVETRIIREEIEEVAFEEKEAKALPAPRGAGRSAKLAWALLALVVAGGLFLWRDPFGIRGRGLGWTPPPIETVAVLPMTNLTGDAGQDYLAAALTESLITELGRSKDLRVIAPSSVRQYTDRSRPLREIAGELGADAVIEASLLRSAGPMRVTARMIHGPSERTLLSVSFDRESYGVSAVPWEIARAVAQQAQSQDSLQEPSTVHRTMDYEAYSLFLKGRHLGNQRKKEALDHFQQAVARDPNFAPAYLGLGETYIWLAGRGYMPTREAVAHARPALTRALELDPKYAEARIVLAVMQAQYEFDFAGADRVLPAAVADAPNYATGHQWYASHLQSMGRFDEAIAELEKAQRLDPRSPAVRSDLGRAFYFARQTDQAIEHYKKALALDPSFKQAHYLLGLAYVQKGQPEEGIREIQEASAIPSAWLGYAYARAGRRDDARKILKERVSAWEREKIFASGIACIHAALGEKDQAFLWLERALETRDPAIAMLNAFPYWDGLRSDARFQDLLRRAGLPAR